jgi:signal transduction histidine kinase
MSAGDIEFIAWVLRDEASTAGAIPPGRRLRLTGAASLKRPTTGPRAFEVLLRSGRDVVMLDPPSWWTSRRVTTAAVALAGAVALLLSYVLLLRRQVNRQTAVIRERLRAETELKEQYRQAQKMESVGRLAGGIAHDFNNIMTVVLGYSEMLGLELQHNPDQMASIKEIQRAAERAAELTRQLLAFGRRSPLQPAVVDLNVVITEIRAMFTRLLGGDIEVVATPADSPVTVMTDRAQLEQALLNLAVNARDAMPNGGRLTMGVARGQSAAGRPTGLLMVGDTGSGIPEDAQAHVFEPFFTTKDVGQGSGLGLSMVYGFMEQSGGTVRFETVVDHGTTFELAFPLAAPAPIVRGA